MSGSAKKSLVTLIGGAGAEAERLRFPISASTAAKADYVLVWMQKAQRSRDNPALELGFNLANAIRLPLLVLFVLVDYPRALRPSYQFMLKGLEECASDIRSRGALFCIDSGEMVPTVARYARQAAVIIADEGKLAPERAWRDALNSSTRLPPLILVETESVIPPRVASDHQEWSAATLRRKISARLPFFLDRPQTLHECRYPAKSADLPSRDELFHYSPALARPQRSKRSNPIGEMRDIDKDEARFGGLIHLQTIKHSPGQSAGMARFKEFIDSGGLDRYDSDRNDPCARGQSEMSPYLHFGQVSPLVLAKAALERSRGAAQPYIEQLVVRRELALNFVLYNPGYDRYESAAPEWARRSLESHSDRKALYTANELERGETADRYWNAAQKEMVLTGKMHNHMRMYWGKQLLSWFPDPAQAYTVALGLNDSYSIDGRDPNGYAGIAWCFGRHDRPWPERPRFGTVRSMMASGLRKKFDADRYAAEVEDHYNKRIKELA